MPSTVAWQLNTTNSTVDFKTKNLLLICRPDAHTDTLLEELWGGGIVQWAGLLHWAGVLQGPRRRGQQTGTAEERTKPKAENKPWSAQSHSHPQGSGQVVTNCYLLLSSVMSLIAAHTLWAATYTFNRLRTPIPQSKPRSAHLLITAGVDTLLTGLSYFLLFIPSVGMCCTSSSCSAPNATLPNPHRSCRQWQTGLAGGGLSPTTVEEKRDQVFSTCNFKQLRPSLRTGVLFLLRCKERPLRQLLWQKRKTCPDIFTHEQSCKALTFGERPDHLCIIRKSALRPVTVAPETWVVRKSPQDRLLI